MALTPGARIGPYELLSVLGVGGMGEVYRARDTKLGRDVALKIVHPHFQKDPAHLARFRTEAQALAALTHPNIAAIFELNDADGVLFFVMEIIEGETLLDKLAHGPLSAAEALRVAAQVAAAIESAHDRGIIHRDLKPANIKITPTGAVKVLDFGLAKVLAGGDSGGMLPDLQTGTSDGVILGTAAYMSPEQARGRPADRRADVWSFGCVLFESLTGLRPFAGDTISDTIASILERDPDWSQLPDSTPATIREVLRRCLQKDVHRRWRDIGDVRLAIEDALTAPNAAREVPPEPRYTRRTPTVAAAVALVALGTALGAVATLLRWTAADTTPRAAHFLIALPPDQQLASLDFPAVAMPPDGSVVAYVATRGGRPQLFLRRMNGIESTPVPGTEDATSPFFSPDGLSIAFFADGKLKRVAVGGGPAATICDAPVGFGGSWGAGDVIVFAPATGSGLLQVSAAGGTPSRASVLDAQKGEFSHRWPELLPDGKTVVFTVGTVGSWEDAQIVAQSLTSGERRVLVQGGTHARYASTGHLLYARAGVIMAVRFNLARLAIEGAPVRLLENVLESTDGAAQLALSRAGDVVYVAGALDSAASRLITIDRKGSSAPIAAPPGRYATPRVGPDGRALLVTIAAATEDVWRYDIPRGTLQQLTFEENASVPVWTPDGRRVVFSSTRAGEANLYWMPSEGGPKERLTSSDHGQIAGSWSPDGGVLAFVERHPTRSRDIWLLPVGGDRKPAIFLASRFDESAPRFSPDGRFLAYVSNESGENEVYVAPLGAATRRRRVSAAGGTEPVWAPNGHELFYRAGDRLMAVRFGAEPHGSGPEAVLDMAPFDKGTLDAANYDVTPDGTRFIVVKAAESAFPHALHVMLNALPSLLATPRR
jgi:serine/threonine-protein kinase